jgi:hypothetical protein
MATPKDKEMHFWAGVSVSFAALVLFKAVEVQHCWLWVLTAVVTAAIGKEVKDLIDYGKFDWRDAVYTIVGGMSGFLLSFF